MKRIKLKLFLASILVSSAISSQAQYFQYLYGANAKVNKEILTDGHNTDLLGRRGHFMVAPDNDLTMLFDVIRTDAAGSATGGAPYFNIQYELSEGYLISTAPDLREVKSLQLSNGTGYALASSYYGTLSGAYGVFYQKLDPVGNPLPSIGPGMATPTGYWVTWGSYRDVHVAKIVESTRNPGDLYILGYLVDATYGTNRMFILKIDEATGGIIWSGYYRVDWSNPRESITPHDIVESTQVNPATGTYEVMVVGEYVKTPGAQIDAFVMRTDYSTGVVLNPWAFFGRSTTNDVFTCIKTSNNTNIDGSGAGYVIGGYTDAVARNDFWFVALDQPGNVIWTNTFDYNNSGSPTANNDYCFDIIERKNTFGRLEYYMTGHTNRGFFGRDDVMVIKADDFGNGVTPNGQFTYGNSDADRSIRIDQFEDPGGGLSMFGYSFWPGSPLGGYDYYLVKSYFNGVTACQYDIQKPIQNSGPKHLFDIYSDFQGNLFKDYKLYTYTYSRLDEWNICYKDGLADGDNSRVLPQTATNETTLYPNPAGIDERTVTLSIYSNREEDVTLSVADMTGRKLLSQTYHVVAGANKLNIDLAGNALAEGVYHVTVDKASGRETIKLKVGK